jgi:hypothetical protein
MPSVWRMQRILTLHRPKQGRLQSRICAWFRHDLLYPCCSFGGANETMCWLPRSRNLQCEQRLAKLFHLPIASPSTNVHSAEWHACASIFAALKSTNECAHQETLHQATNQNTHESPDKIPNKKETRVRGRRGYFVSLDNGLIPLCVNYYKFDIGARQLPSGYRISIKYLVEYVMD